MRYCYIVLLLFSVISTNYGQATESNTFPFADNLSISTTTKNAKKAHKKVLPPYVSFFTTMYGSYDFDRSAHSPMIGFGAEVMLGKKIYYYAKLQAMHVFEDYSLNSSGYSAAWSLSMQALGIGAYFFDQRTTTSSRGWSMAMNLSVGIGINFGSRGDTIDDDIPADSPILGALGNALAQAILEAFYMPIEVSLVSRYHFTANNAFQIGLNIYGEFSAIPLIGYGLSLGFTL